MKMLRSMVLITLGAIAGGAILVAQRISQETGKPLQEAFTDVPAEAQRIFADLRGRACEAVERGREMYLDRQQETYDQSYEDVQS